MTTRDLVLIALFAAVTAVLGLFPALFSGVTAGFLFSWPVAAFVIGWLTEKTWDRYALLHAVTINVFGGILIIYAGGIAWMVAVAGIPLDKALYGSLPFIPGDALKVIAAATAAVALKRYQQHPLGQTV